MAFTYRLTKAKFDKLDDETKAHYKPDGDKHYVLDVEGLDDNDALKRAKDRAEQEVVDLKADLKASEKKVKDLETAAGDGGADIQRLTRAHDRKIATMRDEHSEVLRGRDAFIRETLVDGRALALATEISTVPTLMADNIKKRLDVDFTGEKPKLVIKGKDGNVDPALDMDKLKAEILANPEFKSILVGNRATGSATPKGGLLGTGATLPPQQSGERVDPMSLSGPELAARLKSRADQRLAARGGAE